MSDTSSATECQCGWLQRAVTSDWHPIVFDSEMGEYHLVLECDDGRKGQAILRYCPWCGGTLPKTLRGSYFTQPTPADEEDLHRKLKEIRTVADMRTVLGEPSQCIDHPSRTQYTYSEVWESLELTVTEHKQPLTFFHGGKFIGKSEQSDHQ
jgi:hypothetical protein